MGADVDVQYASEEPDLPDKEILTHWVNVALQYQIPTDSPYPRGNPNTVLPDQIPPAPSQTEKLVELTIRIVDEAEARQLNEKWRQCPKPTNVLSFPFEVPPYVDIPLLGDIIICAPLVAFEAQQQHKSLHAHWAHLVIHGTLHLLGYDHISEQQAQVMENIEIRVLHDLGYPNPYHTIESL